MLCRPFCQPAFSVCWSAFAPKLSAFLNLAVSPNEVPTNLVGFLRLSTRLFSVLLFVTHSVCQLCLFDSASLPCARLSVCYTSSVLAYQLCAGLLFQLPALSCGISVCPPEISFCQPAYCAIMSVFRDRTCLPYFILVSLFATSAGTWFLHCCLDFLFPSFCLHVSNPCMSIFI